MATSNEGQDAIHVVAICGSLRSQSFTRAALEIALSGAAELGASTRLIDLNEYALVMCAGKDDESSYPEDVFRLRTDVRGAQGIILGTPEYHGSFSGVLKNALDLMGFDEFQGKMLGLIGVSGGQLGANNAMAELRTIGRALHAWLVPDQAGIPLARQAFDEHGQLKRDDLAERVRNVGRQVARFAFLHSSKQAQQFLEAWEGAQPNPGGTRPDK